MMMNLPKNVVIVSKGTSSAKDNTDKSNKNGPETNKQEIPPFSELAATDIKKQIQPEADLN